MIKQLGLLHLCKRKFLALWSLSWTYVFILDVLGCLLHCTSGLIRIKAIYKDCPTQVQTHTEWSKEQKLLLPQDNTSLGPNAKREHAYTCRVNQKMKGLTVNFIVGHGQRIGKRKRSVAHLHQLHLYYLYHEHLITNKNSSIYIILHQNYTKIYHFPSF